MSSKKLPAPIVDNESEAINHAIIERIEIATATDLAARTVAREIGYDLPGDSTNPDIICRDIAANMRRSVEAVLDIGRGLLVLKVACGHGNFMARLEALGVGQALANKFMQSARKFSNSSSTTNLLPKVENQTKLFELLVLDDDQVEELLEIGKTGELALDDIACMSVSELRKKLREAKEKIATKDKLIKNQNETIVQLQEDALSKPAITEDSEDNALNEALEALDDAKLYAIAACHAEMIAPINKVLKAVENDDVNKDFADTVISQAVRQIFSALQALAQRFDLELISLDGEAIIDNDPVDIDAATMADLKRHAIACDARGHEDESDGE